MLAQAQLPASFHLREVEKGVDHRCQIFSVAADSAQEIELVPVERVTGADHQEIAVSLDRCQGGAQFMGNLRDESVLEPLSLHLSRHIS